MFPFSKTSKHSWELISPAVSISLTDFEFAFKEINSMVALPDGTVYIADSGNNIIRILTNIRVALRSNNNRFSSNRTGVNSYLPSFNV